MKSIMGRPSLPGETTLQRWDQLLLTSHRLLYSIERSSASSTAILLRGLEWSRIERSHRPLLLVAAPVAALLGMGVLDYSRAFAFAGFFVAVIALVAYVVTRRIVMIFGAGQGRIKVVVLGIDAKSRERARDFANAVDEAALLSGR